MAAENGGGDRGGRWGRASQATSGVEVSLGGRGGESVSGLGGGHGDV